MKECPIRYFIKALIMLARPGAEIKQNFEFCIEEKCAWYGKSWYQRKGGCKFVGSS